MLLLAHVHVQSRDLDVRRPAFKLNGSRCWQVFCVFVKQLLLLISVLHSTAGEPPLQSP